MAWCSPLFRVWGGIRLHFSLNAIWLLLQCVISWRAQEEQVHFKAISVIYALLIRMLLMIWSGEIQQQGVQNQKHKSNLIMANHSAPTAPTCLSVYLFSQGWGRAIVIPCFIWLVTALFLKAFTSSCFPCSLSLHFVRSCRILVMPFDVLAESTHQLAAHSGGHTQW